MNILEIHTEKNTWTPPEIDEYAVAESMAQDVNARHGNRFVYVRYDENRKPVEIKRFAFHEGYMVRYLQTINDFCREAIYMHNCLMTYVEPYINNDMTLLFMRKKDDINMPFITIEIYKNELMQAYHRFNKDCTKEEANWIREYCRRHGIDCSRYQFDKSVDRLF